MPKDFSGTYEGPAKFIVNGIPPLSTVGTVRYTFTQIDRTTYKVVQVYSQEFGGGTETHYLYVDGCNTLRGLETSNFGTFSSVYNFGYKKVTAKYAGNTSTPTPAGGIACLRKIA